MALGDVVRKPEIAIDDGATVVEAARVMRNQNGATLAVVRDGDIVGLLSAKDLVERVLLARLDPEATLVREVMETDIPKASDRLSVWEAIPRMLRDRVFHMAVVDDAGRFKGLVSFQHLVMLHIQHLETSRRKSH